MIGTKFLPSQSDQVAVDELLDLLDGFSLQSTFGCMFEGYLFINKLVYEKEEPGQVFWRIDNGP